MPPRRLRLDAELVRRGLARSREHASELIAAERVKVQGAIATKPATGVTTDVAIVVPTTPTGRTTSPGVGTKLAGALAAFAPLGSGRSTAGVAWTPARRPVASPTSCCATVRAQVVAVDVGYGQLAWQLQQDERVGVYDRMNIRELTPSGSAARSTWWWETCPSSPCSWSSTRWWASPQPTAISVLMVKPQFEVGKERVGKGGVVRDSALRAEAVIAVAEGAARRGWGARAVTVSPLPGPSGNVEFFLWLRHGPTSVTEEDIHSTVRAAASLGVAGEKVDP